MAVCLVVARLVASFVWLGLGLMIREIPAGASPDGLDAVAKVKLWPLPLSFHLLIGVALTGLWITRVWRSSIKLRALGHNACTYQAQGYSAPRGRITIHALAVVGISMITTKLGFLGISSEYSTALGRIILILALSFRSLGRRASWATLSPPIPRRPCGKACRVCHGWVP
jgi:ribose transport system ATP-binding protein